MGLPFFRSSRQAVWTELRRSLLHGSVWALPHAVWWELVTAHNTVISDARCRAHNKNFCFKKIWKDEIKKPVGINFTYTNLLLYLEQTF